MKTPDFPPLPRVRVVIPARDAAATLDRCLDALATSLAAAASAWSECETVVIDDGSRDDTAARAARHGARVLAAPGASQGAAAARNRGAAAAGADVLLFLDADVEVEASAVAELLSILATGLDAAVGVYAPCDPALGAWSRTKDRSIRLNHARGGREIPWFWTALGAVRSEAFHRVGGFDERWFGAGATVEDMDLGLRLTAAGCRIAQVPAARARHRHRFGPAGLLRNDFAKSRAWMRLLLRQGAGAQAAHASTRRSEAVALAFSLGALAGAASTPLAPLAAVPVTAASLGALAWLLREDLRMAHEESGASEAALHLLVRAMTYPAAGAGAAAAILAHAGGGGAR